jgi:hypothetical protein
MDFTDWLLGLHGRWSSGPIGSASPHSGFWPPFEFVMGCQKSPAQDYYWDETKGHDTIGLARSLWVGLLFCITVMLDWDICRLFIDVDHKIQEQAFWIVRNLAENESGVELVFRELGANALFSCLTMGLESPHEEVVLQVYYVISTKQIVYLSASRLHVSWPTSLTEMRPTKT